MRRLVVRELLDIVDTSEDDFEFVSTIAAIIVENEGVVVINAGDEGLDYALRGYGTVRLDGKDYTPSDGVEFMNALETEYESSTFVHITEEEDAFSTGSETSH